MTAISLIIAVASLAGGTPTEFDQTHGQLDRVLAHYVDSGLVDYAALKNDRADLDGYLDSAGTITMAEFQRWGHNDQLAYLINVYNATTLRLVIDNYPVESIKSIGSLLHGPWDKKVVRLFGKTVSLNTLEHKIIRQRYAEPRVHFSLVCAAVGCPPLRGEAYRGDRLDGQLNAQAITFLDQSEKNRVDWEGGKLWVSPIFKWYRDDFEGAAGTLNSYLQPYLLAPTDPRNIMKFEIAFTDYDWSLNDRATQEK